MKSVVGSFVSVLAGWAAGPLCLGIYISVTNANADLWTLIWKAPLAGIGYGLSMGIYALPVWLFLFLPLYAFVPRRSVLWSPALCTTLGALAGGAIMALTVQSANAQGWRESYPLILIAAVTGAVTAFTATQNVNYFRGEEEECLPYSY